MREDPHHPTPFSPWSTTMVYIFLCYFNDFFGGFKAFRSPVGLKEIVLWDEYYFWRLIIKIGTFFLYMRWYFLQFFVSYLMKKSYSKFKFAPLKLLTNFENSSSNLLHRPSSGDFDTENAYRKPPWFFESIQETSCDKIIFAHYPCSQWEVSTIEHPPITEKEILRRVSASNFKISK